MFVLSSSRNIFFWYILRPLTRTVILLYNITFISFAFLNSFFSLYPVFRDPIGHPKLAYRNKNWTSSNFWSFPLFPTTDLKLNWRPLDQSAFLEKPLMQDCQLVCREFILISSGDNGSIHLHQSLNSVLVSSNCGFWLLISKVNIFKSLVEAFCSVV